MGCGISYLDEKLNSSAKIVTGRDSGLKMIREQSSALEMGTPKTLG
jgi:hypothetical protein